MTIDHINAALKRYTGQAKELLELVKKEIEDVAEAFATGQPPGTAKTCQCGCEVSTDETPCDASHCVLHAEGEER